LKLIRNFQQLQDYEKNLTEELNRGIDQLKTTSTASFEDSRVILSLNRDLLKIQTDLKLCAEREENEIAETHNLELKREEIEHRIEEEKRKKIIALEPLIRRSEEEIAETKVQFQF
jgi:hypothetical protein